MQQWRVILSTNKNEAKHIHLEAWCERYFKDHQMKIHPAAVPSEIILNELLGRIEEIEARLPDTMKAPVKKVVIETVMVRGVEIPLSELTGLMDKKGKK
jgi:hypothetical protein